MTKLLNKPLRTFIAFTSVILALSIPVYFYVVESIWIEELDDHNQQLKKQIQTQFTDLKPEALSEKIAFWNQIQINSRITPASGYRKDSVYILEKEMLDDGQTELARFRGLLSVISLNGKPYFISVETNMEEVHQTILSISIITCIFIVSLTIGFILLSRRLSKKIWAPFTDTLEKLKAFDLNSTKTIHFETTDVTEFIELNNVLVKFIDTNISIYQQQKEFAQNASHELQTPLALLKTKVDMLIQDPTLTEQQRKIIESLDNSISRVSRINKNLLLLSRIENKHYETEDVDLSELLRSQVDNFKDFVENKGCRISANIEAGIKVRANESLVEIMVSNFFSNTVRHGLANSGITVRLNDQALIVANEGKASLNENKLFKRFISATTDNPGTGLGLAIVKEICDRYRWQVSYRFIKDQHIFSVLFSDSKFKV